MKLIDADELREAVEFHVTSVSVCGTVAEARGMTRFKEICLEDIDNAPAVDAIPIAWIKQQPIYQTIAVRALIDRWHEMGDKE